MPMITRKGRLLLTALALAGCASGADPAAGLSASVDPANSPAGCWTLSAPGSVRGVLPPLAVLRLDTAALSARPADGMRVDMYVPGEPPGRVSGRSSWMVLSGGSLQMRIEDAVGGVEVRGRVVGDRMRGHVRGLRDSMSRAAEWGSMRGSRVTCPRELS